MLRRLFKATFTVLLVLTLSGAALGLQPQDALSARPAESLYTVLRIDNLNGLLQYIFSPANVELVAQLLGSDEAQIVNLIASLASQIPAQSVLIGLGMTNEGPFIQAVASMPDSARPKLDRVADGSAGGVEIVTLLLGDGGMMFAGGFEPEKTVGAKGPFYSVLGMGAIAAKDNLLLLTSSQAELEAAIDALEKAENRLSFKSRFESPNYWQIHVDMQTAAGLAGMFGDSVPGLTEAYDQLSEFFKAPLEIEFGLTLKPESVLLSCAMNILECLADSAVFEGLKPVPGGNLLLAGGGKLLLALSSPIAFKIPNMSGQPEVAEAWDKAIEGLEKINLTAGDLEDLLNGSFSIAFGSDATVMGASVPGGYLAFTGREGAAARILGKIMGIEELEGAPLVALNVDGWSSVFTVDPAVSPAPIVFGVTNDTLFAGVVNPAALADKPELPAEITGMLGDTLFAVGVIDIIGMWNRLRQEVADPGSLLSSMVPDPSFKDLLNFVLEADLSVPLVKMWSPELELCFTEFSLADIPQEKRLIPRLIQLGQMLGVGQGEEDE